MRLFVCTTKKCLPTVPRGLGIVITVYFLKMLIIRQKMSAVNERPFSLLYKDVKNSQLR